MLHVSSNVIMYLLGFAVVTLYVAEVVCQTIDQTYVVENGTTIVIPCNLTSSYNYPGWMGPPVRSGGSWTLYNYDRSSSFFTSLINRDRLSWASNKKDLILSEVRIRSDEGRYQCAVTGVGWWTLQLNVRVRPGRPQIMQPVALNSQIIGLQGVALKLICVSTGGYPEQTLDWYLVRNGQSPTRMTNCLTHVALNNLYDVTSTCTFTPTYGDDGATFLCQSSYNGDPQLKDSTGVQFEIGVIPPSQPTVTSMGLAIENREGTAVAMCESSGFRPKTVNVTWTRQDQSEPDFTPTVTDMGNNTFTLVSQYLWPLNRRHNGKTLTCSVSHMALNQPVTQTITIYVLFPPRYTTISGDTHVYANGVNKITLTCGTDSSSPPSSITWYMDGLRVTSNKNTTLTNGDYGGQLTSQELQFVPSREMDGQVVECRASNEIYSDTAASSSLSLDLRYSPEITIDFRHPSATEPGWLKCTVSSNPASNITWYRLSPSLHVIVDSIIRGNNFVNYSIADATGFEGVFRCTADNGLGIVVNSETRIMKTHATEAGCECSSSLPLLAGSTVGGFAIGTIVTLVATVIFLRIRRARSGKDRSNVSIQENKSERSPDRDPCRTYETLSDIPRDAPYNIPDRRHMTSVL